MRAVVLGEGGQLAVREVPLQDAHPGEALVRVLVAGICSTDLELRRGYMGFQGVPGHEFVGRVERAPVGYEALLGKRVVGEINAACGQCETCARGLPRHCPRRTVLGILGRSGAMAELLWLPAGNLREVPDVLATDRALFTEPVAAAYEVLEQVAVRGKRVLVMGAGKLGGLVAQVLALAGASITVVGRHERLLVPLAEAGISVTASVESLPPRSFPMIVEATGQPEGFESALGLVEPRGTIVLKSTCASARPLNLAPVVIDEVTVIGSRCGPFEPSLAALAAGRLSPESTIDARFELADASSAFDEASRPGVRKVVLDISS